jgi:hypothetical protein
VANELDEAFEGVNQLLKPLSQLAIAGGKIVLGDMIESGRAKGGGDGLPGGVKLFIGDGKKLDIQFLFCKNASAFLPCSTAVDNRPLTLHSPGCFYGAIR